MVHVVLKYGPNPASFRLFSFFSQCENKYCTNLNINEKSKDVVMGFEPKTAVL